MPSSWLRDQRTVVFAGHHDGYPMALLSVLETLGEVI